MPRHWPREKGQKVKLPDYTNSEISERIDDLIHSERDRQILKRRLIDGLTFESLAEESDMSVAQIKRIIYRGVERIFSQRY